MLRGSKLLTICNTLRVLLWNRFLSNATRGVSLHIYTLHLYASIVPGTPHSALVYGGAGGEVEEEESGWREREGEGRGGGQATEWLIL